MEDHTSSEALYINPALASSDRFIPKGVVADMQFSRVRIKEKVRAEAYHSAVRSATSSLGAVNMIYGIIVISSTNSTNEPMKLEPFHILFQFRLWNQGHFWSMYEITCGARWLWALIHLP